MLDTEKPKAAATKKAPGEHSQEGSSPRIEPSPNAQRLPDKIMAILLKEEAPDAIWWLQNGTAFAMQKEKFEKQVLDKHFRGNKFKSLVRNLHRWYVRLLKVPVVFPSCLLFSPINHETAHLNLLSASLTGVSSG